MGGTACYNLRLERQMAETLATTEAVVEVISPDGARRYARVSQTPYMMGRGAETGNHLQLNDRRISRQCAAIVMEASRLYIEDRGQRRGVFVNNEKIDSRALEDGDIITFGLEDSYEIIFRSTPDAGQESIPNLLTRIEHITSSEPASGGLRKLNMLLEASSLLHSQLPLDSVLAKMLDHAVAGLGAAPGPTLADRWGGAPEGRAARRRGRVVSRRARRAFWIKEAWSSANGNGNAWSRRARWRAIFSKRCCRAVSANFRIWTFPDAISLAWLWEGITLMCSRLPKDEPRFCLRTF